MDYFESVKDEWYRGKAWIDNYTRDYVQLDTLADGISLHNQKGAPRVGTVALQNSVREIPRNSVNQVPTMSMIINGTSLSLDAIIASYLLRSVVFNEDTFGNGVLATMQMAAQTALTQGFVALRANVGKVFNKFSTTLETIHYNDIVIEPGVFDASNSSYYHVRTRVTKGQLAELIKNAKANPNTLWDVQALEELYAAGPQPMGYNRFLSPARVNAGANGDNQYDFITRYGVGPYYKICVYSPQGTKPLMEMKSKSKFGYPRVSLLVIDPAQLSPFGISRARLASPMANYGNIYLQSTAKMQLLNADAPVFRRGMFSGATPLRRGAQWESQDPNADVKIMELSNSTLQQFDAVLSYIDQQVLSTMGVTSASDPGTNSAYQNTAAVNARIGSRDMSSQQVRLLIENALRQYGMTAFDLFVSEQIGSSALIVDDEAKDAINRLHPPQDTVDAMGNIIPGAPFVGDDNVVNVDWEAFYNRIQTMSVRIDLSVGKTELEEKKRGDLQDTFVTMKQNANTPEDMADANMIGKELIKETLPDISKQLDNTPPAPAAAQPMAAGQGGMATVPMRSMGQ